MVRLICFSIPEYITDIFFFEKKGGGGQRHWMSGECFDGGYFKFIECIDLKMIKMDMIRQ